MFSILILFLLSENKCNQQLFLENARYVAGSKNGGGASFCFMGNDLHIGHETGHCTVVPDAWEEGFQYIQSAGILVSFPRFSVSEIMLTHKTGTRESIVLSAPRPIWDVELRKDSIFATGYLEGELFVALYNWKGNLQKELRFPSSNKIGQKHKVFSLFHGERLYVWAARGHELFVFSDQLDLLIKTDLDMPDVISSFDRNLLRTLFELSDGSKMDDLRSSCEKHRGHALNLFPTSFFVRDETLFCAWRFQKLFGCIQGSMVESKSQCLITKMSLDGLDLGFQSCEDLYVNGLFNREFIIGRKWYSDGLPGKGDWKYLAVPLTSR